MRPGEGLEMSEEIESLLWDVEEFWWEGGSECDIWREAAGVGIDCNDIG
jgi:hypothetical protein